MLVSMANLFPHKLTSIPKNALISTFLVANTFVWYLCIFTFLQNFSYTLDSSGKIAENVAVISILSLVIFAIIGAAFIDRYKQRMTFLRFWVIAGFFISLSLIILTLSNSGLLIIDAGIAGAYFGLGMPICVGYFSASTVPENRAELSALIILSIGVFFPIISFIASGIFFAVATFAIWQLLGLICIIALKPPEQRVEQKDKVSYRSIISNKAFLFYLVPWLMFSLINDLTRSVNYNYFFKTFPEFAQNYSTVELILSGIIAIMFGILADKKGRKRLALIGFFLLGLGYASLGLFGNLTSAWFYIFADGVAWGAFSMLFLFTVWGDIAQGKSSEKYYIIGVLPYLFSTMIRFPFNQVMANVQESVVFSFASFFLFAAVLPLAYAPETLSDRIIRDLDINSYIHKALEKVKKENMKRERVS